MFHHHHKYQPRHNYQQYYISTSSYISIIIYISREMEMVTETSLEKKGQKKTFVN